jgi:hypothetical protein
MKNILKYSSQINIILTIVLIISLNSLPQRIKKSIENNIKDDTVDTVDTVVVEKTITANIGVKGDFIFFSGMLNGKSYKMLEYFSYDTRFPEAIFDGYLNPAISVNKGEYYIWSKNKISDDLLISFNKISGWFVTDGNRFQSIIDSGKYYQILYPIVDKK